MNLKKIFQNKIFTNASWIVVCRIAQAVCSLIVTMITARYLGPSRYGLISYAASMCTFFLPIMQLGLPNIQVQELVYNKDLEGDIIGTSLLLSFICSIVCIVGIFGFSLIANKGELETIIVCVLYSLLLFFQSIEIIQYWFQSHYIFKYVSVVTLVAYIIVSIYKIYLLATGRSIYLYALSYTLDHFIISALLLVIYKNKNGPRLVVNPILAKKLLEKSKYYIVANLMLVIFAQTDRIMLKLICGDEITGYYSSAVAIANMVNFLYDAIIDSFRPSIFEAKKRDNDKYEADLKLLMCVIIYISAIVCIGVCIFAKFGILVLYGKAYLPAATSLRIVVWYTFFAYIGTVRNIWLLAEAKQSYLWKINLLGAVTNICLNCVFIPILSAEGAALASLISQFFTNFLLSSIMRNLKPFFHIILKSLDIRLIINRFK